MTLRHIQIFRTLYENECNTTKAAQALNMTQPAVSLAIKELEQHYDVVLFERVGRRLVITRAGERFFEYCRSIENAFHDMETEMKNWDRHGTIRVGGTLTIGSRFMPRYVKLFRDSYPDIKIKGLCAPANILERKILDNEIDVAFSEGLAKDAMIVSKEYMDDHLVVFSKKGGKYAAGETISIEELCSNDLVLREFGSGTRKVFDEACEKAGFTVEPMIESFSIAGIINAVAEGLGLGVLSYRLIDRAVEENMVVPIQVEGLDLRRKFYIIYHKDKKLSTAVKYFLYLCNDINFEIEEEF